VKQEQVKELLLQSLQHERGGVQVYETALECVVNEKLRPEFQYATAAIGTSRTCQRERPVKRPT
jgi:hypothetical protein